MGQGFGQCLKVMHLVDGPVARAHVLSDAARRESQRLVYDRHVTGSLDL